MTTFRIRQNTRFKKLETGEIFIIRFIRLTMQPNGEITTSFDCIKTEDYSSHTWAMTDFVKAYKAGEITVQEFSDSEWVKFVADADG